MQIRIFFIFLLAAAIFQSCQDDIIGETETTTILTNPEVNIASGVNGIIVDQDGNAIQNVVIEYNNKDQRSDENGYFKIENTSVNESGGYLSFSKPGYFNNFKFFLPETGVNSFLRVKMISRQLSGNISAVNGGSLDLPGGASITFPKDAFKLENGNSYDGGVRVFAHWFDPASNDISAAMPGDLRGLNESSEIVQLATFGMMAVELESDNGQKLQLKDNITAELIFPVPDKIIGDAPSEILTWSFDEANGYWKEEGAAVLNNNQYIAEVSHFSFWNCDAPFPVVEIYGKLVDQDGNPLPFYSICIQAFNNTQTGYGWSNLDGGFRGKIPKDEMLNFVVKDDCGDIVFEQKIGPFNTAVSLGNIVIQDQSQVTIHGILLDCDSKPVSNGYVKIDLEGVNNYYIAETNELGEWSLNLVRCQTIGIFTVQGVDLDNLTYSEILEVEGFEQIEIPVEDLIACEELDEFIQVKLESGDIFLNTDVDAQIVDGTLHISSGWDSISNFVIDAQIADAQIGTNTVVDYFSLVIETPSIGLWGACGDAIQGGECQNFTFTITDFGIVGDYVEGEYMGELEFQGSGSTQVVMGSFRIRIDEIIDRGSVSGVVWLDDNMNGIRESGELPGEVRSITLYTSNGGRIERLTNLSEYELHFNESGEYYLEVELFGGFQLSPADQGSDDSIDSDFDPVTYRTDIFYVDAGQEVPGFDIGISYTGVMTCDIELIENDYCFSGNGGVLVIVEGASPPFTAQLFLDGVELPNQVFDDNVMELFGLIGGEYLIVITDANGNICETEFFVESFDIECFINGSPPLCNQNDGTLEVNTNVWQIGGFPQITWSNGSTELILQDVSPGIYTVTITDINSQCEAVCTYELESLGNESSVVGKIWADSLGVNINTYDTGDLRLSQVEVRLYESSDLTNPVNTTFTDINGVYTFEDLVPGEYQVEVIPYQNLTFVDQDFGMDDTIDSDIDPATGRSALFELDICNVIDAGLKF
ncbi:MAG: hypothetical protein KJO29_10775 [Bacteroidia bacterium]|nr:hypothetical protein [Bacteroidia bacterium]